MINAARQRAELDLVAHWGLSTVKARNLVVELDGASTWIARFGLMTARCRKMPPTRVRRWLLEHGWMTEREFGPGGTRELQAN